MTGLDRDAVFGSMNDLEETMTMVAASLGIVMELRDSLYMGGDYYLGHLDDGSDVRVRPNVDLIDDVREISGWAGPVFVELDVRSVDGPAAVAVGILLEAGFPRIARER